MVNYSIPLYHVHIYYTTTKVQYLIFTYNSEQIVMYDTNKE